MASNMLKPLMLICVLLWVFQQMEATLQNVGVKGTAVQSSSNGVGVASRAIDGDTNGYYMRGSCTHTQPVASLNQWWKVDLGDYYLVEEIHVYNRLDCCGERLYDVYSDVSNDDNDYRTFGFHAGRVGAMEKILPKKSMSARWVKIYMKGNRILCLCEVKVMSRYTMKEIYFDGEPQGEEQMVSVKSVPVPLRVVIKCIQSCSRTEKSFFTRLIDESTSSLYLECYCPI